MERKRRKEGCPLMLDQWIRHLGHCMLHAIFSSALNISGIVRGLEEFLIAALVVRLSLLDSFFFAKHYDEKKSSLVHFSAACFFHRHRARAFLFLGCGCGHPQSCLHVGG